MNSFRCFAHAMMLRVVGPALVVGLGTSAHAASLLPGPTDPQPEFDLGALAQIPSAGLFDSDGVEVTGLVRDFDREFEVRLTDDGNLARAEALHRTFEWSASRLAFIQNAVAQGRGEDFQAVGSVTFRTFFTFTEEQVTLSYNAAIRGDGRDIGQRFIRMTDRDTNEVVFESNGHTTIERQFIALPRGSYEFFVQSFAQRFPEQSGSQREDGVAFIQPNLSLRISSIIIPSPTTFAGGAALLSMLCLSRPSTRRNGLTGVRPPSQEHTASG